MNERQLFDNLHQCLAQTVGDMAARLMIGHTCAYAAAPQIFAEFGCFPGLVIYGPIASGKTTIATWLSSLYPESSRRYSAPGMSRAELQEVLCQHSNLPVWIDEFLEPDQSFTFGPLLLSAFTRELPARFSSNSGGCLATTPVLISQRPMREAAMHSRYLHVEINPALRRHDCRAELNRSSREFHRIGDYLRQHSEAFSKLVITGLRHRGDLINDRDVFLLATAKEAFNNARTILLP